MALRERITETRDLLEIMPDKFYFDTLRPHMKEMWANVKFDPILTDTIEKTLNEADGHAGNKRYQDLAVAFNVLTGVLVDPKSTYQRSDSFIRATESDKESVRVLTKHIQDLLAIIKCTKVEPKTEVIEKRERLGYDVSRKENILYDTSSAEAKERIPSL